MGELAFILCLLPHVHKVAATGPGLRHVQGRKKAGTSYSSFFIKKAKADFHLGPWLELCSVVPLAVREAGNLNIWLFQALGLGDLEEGSQPGTQSSQAAQSAAPWHLPGTADSPTQDPPTSTPLSASRHHQARPPPHPNWLTASAPSISYTAA